jgi:plasmid maintenance system antidote protein VapI
MKLGEFIELTLWYKHISKSELAKEMGTSETSVGRLIQDSIKLPPMKMQKLSKILDVPLEILFMWQGYDLAKRYKEESTEVNL